MRKTQYREDDAASIIYNTCPAYPPSKSVLAVVTHKIIRHNNTQNSYNNIHKMFKHISSPVALGESLGPRSWLPFDPFSDYRCGSHNQNNSDDRHCQKLACR